MANLLLDFYIEQSIRELEEQIPDTCASCRRIRTNSCPQTKLDPRRMVRVYAHPENPRCEDWSVNDQFSPIMEEITMLKLSKNID